MPVNQVVSQGATPGRTYETVVITQSSAGWKLIKALVSGKVITLHKLYLKSDTTGAGTITIQSADDSNGTSAVALTGAFPLAVYDTFKDESNVASHCLQTPSGKALGFTTATAKVYGYAVISYLT